jgi:hypothetical protein
MLEHLTQWITSLPAILIYFTIGMIPIFLIVFAPLSNISTLKNWNDNLQSAFLSSLALNNIIILVYAVIYAWRYYGFLYWFVMEIGNAFAVSILGMVGYLLSILYRLP